ncbi:MAG: hypothetical protein R3359_02440 [Marinirhabdus sp.]|nr:hypothetical protein [Marinirhabdus sp.]
MSSTTYLSEILGFLKAIDVTVVETSLEDKCFVPGLKIEKDAIYLDTNRLEFAGDLLHEAGHLAVTPAKQRQHIGTSKMCPEWPSLGDEIVAMLWSFAAARHLQIPIDIVFHEGGYKGQSKWLITQFNTGNYLGLPLLVWMGLCEAEQFPKMNKWLRD